MRWVMVAVFAALVAAAGRAEAATAPYSATASDAGCNGQKSCTLSFPIVASGSSLALTHVSCAIETSGLSGGVTDLMLATGKSSTLGDHLPPNLFVSGSNGATVANASTLLYVAAGDRAIVTVTSGSAIVATSDGGCYIAGTVTP